MESTSLGPKQNHDFSGQKVQLDISSNDYQIKPGMSPKEISDVVSDHLINVVRQQFESAKKEFRAKK